MISTTIVGLQRRCLNNNLCCNPIGNNPAKERGQGANTKQEKPKRTTQSSCLLKPGTSRPCSSAAGQAFESILSITVAIGWVVRREDQDRFVIVSYSMTFPRWHWFSIAYPAIPQAESEPVQVPIAIGSAVCHTCVMWCIEGYGKKP
jgi:hypothetical protein